MDNQPNNRTSNHTNRRTNNRTSNRTNNHKEARGAIGRAPNSRQPTGYVAPEEHIPAPAKDDLVFLPLGGSGEIGMNVNLYGTNRHWIMVDLGIAFGDGVQGVDFITANLDLIKRSQIDKTLKGVVITHAHEDHIGGIHTVWPHFKFHIYVTKFAKEVLLKKLEDRPYCDEVKDFYLHEVPANGRVTLGDFDIEFMNITHSIPDCNSLLIRTPLGNILHTGDWKLDPAPVIGEPINPKRFQQLAKENIQALICDSTNVLTPGRSGSEIEVLKTFQRLFVDKRYKRGRLVAACFASNVARIKGMADAARSVGRKVCLLGRSILKMTEAADKCQMPIHLDHFVDEETAYRLKPHEVMYICTGSQGDENAAFAKIARGVHRLRLSAGDTAFFSSKIIPGNERRVNVLMNNLARIGVRIITEKEEKIHVSGHPCQEELKDMYRWVQPKFVIPVHGEIRHLVEHVQLAKSCGFDGLMPENGTLISIPRRKIIKRYNVSRWGYDGNRFIDMHSPIIKEREAMGTAGVVFMSLVLGKENRMISDRSVVSCSGLMEMGDDTLNVRVKEAVEHLMAHKGDGKPMRLQPEPFRNNKIIERVRMVVRSALNKMPHVRVHWVYVR